MDLIIKQKHIKGSIRRNPAKCPAAKAFKDAGFKGVQVNRHEVVYDGGSYSHNLPLTLRKAIDMFDRGGKFKIGTYRIAGLENPSKKR